MKGYIIVNLQREFYTGSKWDKQKELVSAVVTNELAKSPEIQVIDNSLDELKASLVRSIFCALEITILKSERWSYDADKAVVYKTVLEAIEIAKPMSLKAFVVENYGMFDEREAYKNYNGGRSLVWGRQGVMP
jgi:hypothetical protein